MLFLAISGALFIIGLTYMTGTVRSVRFQDATQTVESFIERQYSAVQTNSVARTDWAGGATPGNRLGATCTAGAAIAINDNMTAAAAAGQGNSASCILLGAELVFGTYGPSATTVDVYPILGYAGANTGQSTIDSLQAANPRVLTTRSTTTDYGPTESFLLPWGTNFAKMKSVPAGPGTGGYNAIAILRSPQSESINMIYHTASTNPGTLRALDLRPSIIAIPSQRNIRAALCLQSPGDDRRGAILLNGTSGSENFSISSISSSLKTTTDVLVPGTGLTCA
jgi:type II secretory pathway pseudopilin PulG